MKSTPKIFIKDSEVSKPSIVLLIGWVLILIWYIITDFPFMADWPLMDIFAIPFLTLLCAYYFGKYNLSLLKSGTTDLWKKYQQNK